MNILYVAYSCSPNKGSEEKIGWNVPLESAKNNNVFVVTKEEHRQTIEEYVRAHNIEKPKFYFVDINKVYKKVFKGAMYSVRLNFWHKKALPVVREICEREHIDVIHQITPIEFRSIGNYAGIGNTRFVCGPLGGGEALPKGLSAYAKGNMKVEYFRALLNRWSRFKYKISEKLSRCDYLLFVNKETYEYVSDLIKDRKYCIYPEIGINEYEIAEKRHKPDANKEITFLVAGRLAYRKGHSLLFDVLKELPEDFHYSLRIVGEGPERSKLEAKCRACNLQDKVVFTGRLAFTDMAQEYNHADVFIMPSLREATGTVLLEAIANGLPVITINRFGGSVLLEGGCAYFYDGNSEKEIKNGLRNAILSAASDVEEGRNFTEILADRAKQYSWKNKLSLYSSIYDDVTDNGEKICNR